MSSVKKKCYECGEVYPGNFVDCPECGHRLFTWENGADNSRFHKSFIMDDVEGQFHGVPNEVLATVIKGEIDLNLIASYELANRGLAGNGKWVGFPVAKQMHSARVEEKEWSNVKQLKMEAEDMAAENRRLEAENTRLLKAAGKLK